ncbi:hypothetical protein ACIBF5_08555 [Micromonospora sp. NPDC050417]|uniref:hypothetical protein n=1 Tax=Micromonospora sp. NPDC050417 TaxID=3364280 RepID=UPI0037B6ADEB
MPSGAGLVELADGPGLPEVLGVADPVGLVDVLGLVEPVGLGLVDPVGVGLVEPVGVGLVEPVGVGEGVGLPDPVGVGGRGPISTVMSTDPELLGPGTGAAPAYAGRAATTAATSAVRPPASGRRSLLIRRPVSTRPRSAASIITVNGSY